MYQARYLYSELAQAIQSRKSCEQSGNTEWFDKWSERIKLFESLLPHGSGFDSGTKVNLDESHADRLVFETSFHHMDGAGYYSGWTEHTVTLTPAFIGRFHLRISGRNRNDIKEYIASEFDHVLSLDVTYELFREQFPQYGITAKWENEDGSPSECYQAFYVGSERFWNRGSDARARAALLMDEAWTKQLQTPKETGL
jgi:hypothetical protein